MGARRHRRDLYLGSRAGEGQAVGHRADDVGPGCERKRQGNLRRLRREPQVRAREPRVRHALREGARRRRCRLPCACSRVEGRLAAGRGGGEGVGRERAGRAGQPRALRIPDGGRAGVADVARRRCAIGRREVARGHRHVPQIAGHDPDGAVRLFGRRRSAVRAEGRALSTATQRIAEHRS
ncbi:hypothetical protein EMIT0111MI5_130127 [Burkholderia sp. IT-111MI5]